MSDMSVQGLQRQAERKTRLLKGLMQTARQAEIPFVIRNLSATGLGGSVSGGPPQVGTDVTVLLPSGKLAAGQVRWVNGKNFGLQFAEPIPLDDQRSEPVAVQSSTWQVQALHKVETPRINPGSLRRI